MTGQRQKWVVRGAGLLALMLLAILVWQKFGKGREDNNLASGNGRIEAVEIDVATKSSGRVKEILVREGDLVGVGQVLAVMDTEVLDAQFRQAEAQLHQARTAVATAQSQLAQRQSERVAALAALGQREAELDNARTRRDRSAGLVAQGAMSRQEADDDATRLKSAGAAVVSAKAQVAAVEAAVVTAQTQIAGAEAAVAAAQATVERIQADIKDSALKAPRNGRVQYRVAQPGEVVGAGGRVLNLVDLGDVYMTFFLPTAAAGRIVLGSEVRLVLDAAPEYVLPARVSFVADVAQFTPKTVETASEREKLMFRVRAQLPQDFLDKHIDRVKTGLPGMAYVRLDAARPWPVHLQVKLPQ
ncbi:MAG: HlyD family secretion protein [Thermodesulfobacteriota bacterium]